MAKFEVNPNDYIKDIPKPKWIRWILGMVIVIVVAVTAIFWPASVDPLPVPTPIDTLINKQDTSKVGLEAENGQNNSVAESTLSRSSDVSEQVMGKIHNAGAETKNVKVLNSYQSGDITLDAKKAIRGDFGNGAERRRILGENYERVQAVVNRLYKECKLQW